MKKFARITIILYLFFSQVSVAGIDNADHIDIKMGDIISINDTDIQQSNSGVSMGSIGYQGTDSSVQVYHSGSTNGNIVSNNQGYSYNSVDLMSSSNEIELLKSKIKKLESENNLLKLKIKYEIKSDTEDSTSEFNKECNLSNNSKDSKDNDSSL